MGTYIVKPGDTLTAIARQYRGDPEGWRDIAASNALKNPNRLQVGQALEIEGYEPPQAEGIPDPTLNPRRDFSQSRGNAFGARPPVAETTMLPSPRAAGAEEMAIPEAPTLPNRAGSEDWTRAFDEPGPLTQAAENPLPERPNITPSFNIAEPGAGFDPPTGAKIAQMMKMFKERPELVDQVLQQLMGAEAGM